MPALTDQLLLQLTWHWENQLRPRLAGLTDEEYLWEPVPGMWSLRPRGREHTRLASGLGAWVAEIEIPEPDPAPATTIAWQFVHLLAGIFGDRNARHFGAPPLGYGTLDNPGTADEALRQLDAGYATWVTGVSRLSDEDLWSPCGEPGFESDPMLALILHIHREIIHHGAVISTLRDLYAWRSPES